MVHLTVSLLRLGAMGLILQASLSFAVEEPSSEDD